MKVLLETNVFFGSLRTVAFLHFHHKDPFDHLIAAQAFGGSDFPNTRVRERPKDGHIQ